MWISLLIVLFIRKRNRSSRLNQHDQSNRLAADSSTSVKSSDTGAEQPTLLYSYYLTSTLLYHRRDNCGERLMCGRIHDNLLTG